MKSYNKLLNLLGPFDAYARPLIALGVLFIFANSARINGQYDGFLQGVGAAVVYDFINSLLQYWEKDRWKKEDEDGEKKR